MGPWNQIFQPLVLISGKGGVGRTRISFDLAQKFSQIQKTAWITIEDPNYPIGSRLIKKNLSHLNFSRTEAFFEYLSLKLKVMSAFKVLSKAKVIQYLVEAAPGLKDLVSIGKVWHETKNYEKIILDMPSTGYGLAFFHATQSFCNLFEGGPIQSDARSILNFCNDPQKTAFMITTLAEKSPIEEADELASEWKKIFPKNPEFWILNKIPILKAKKNQIPKGIFLENFAELHTRIQERSLEAQEMLLNKKINFFKIPLAHDSDGPLEWT